MDETVLVKDLPAVLVESVIQDLTNYTIGFLRVTEGPRAVDAELLGSGVLVSAGTKRAIVTADHVVQILPRSGRVGLILGRTTQPHTIDADAMVPIRIGRGSVESVGPDLAVSILAPHIAGAIAAKKLFFNLDSRREQLLSSPPGLRDGVWFSHGFLQEGTHVAPDHLEEGLTKYFYNFTGVGGPDVIETLDDYDYFDFPVSHQSRSNAPLSWGGMSGGGIWQVQLKRVDGMLTHLPPILSGVAFYQHPTTETECGIKAHGRRSIYENVVRAICEP